MTLQTTPAERHRLALAALRTGRFAEAWPLYEARRELPWIDVPTPITDAPEWRGEDPRGKRIVVCVEQGWGDQIMFGRYLGLLAALGAEVAIACHPKVARWFERLGYWTKPLFTDRPIPDCDYWTLFCSLPLRLKHPHPPAAEYLPLSGSGAGIGVVAQGNPAHRNDANRSLPADLAPALLGLGRNLLPEATGCWDFSDTADLMRDLDLVITVDTATAHLAGAIGKRCWVLLPHTNLDWRWGDGVTSPWYPAMRLFRQPLAGDWRSVLSEVARSVELAW